MSDCRERLLQAARQASRIGGGTGYVELMEWNRVKRVLAEAAADCIRGMLGDRVVTIYYTDLSGGELAEVGGRDIDLVVVVKPGVDAAKLEEELESKLNAMVSGEQLKQFTGGKGPFEVHVVVEGSQGYAASLARSRYAPPTRL